MNKTFNKRLVALICVAFMIFGCISVCASERFIPFDTKMENPLLDLPVSEKIIMKDGTLVIEAEHVEYEKCMLPVSEERASGEMGLKTVAGSYLQDHTLEPKASMRVNVVVENEKTYYIWLRSRCTNTEGYITFWKDLGNKNLYGMQTAKYVENYAYEWHSLGSQTLVSGFNTINLKYRSNNAVFDKFIITDREDFVPVGADDVPEKNTSSGGEINTDGIPVYPTVGAHPRLFFTEEEIPEIKAKLEMSIFKPSYDNFKKQADTVINAELPEGNASFTSYSAYPTVLMSKAFMYAIGEKDATFAKETIRQARNFVSTVKFDRPNDTTYNSREMGETMVMAACVYDWCYDLLTEDDKAFFVEQLPKIAGNTEVGFPPTGRNYVLSHTCEELVYRDQLAPAIALYDEYPYWYNAVGSVIFDKMIPVKNYYNVSGTDFSGSTYSESRNIGAVQAEKMIHTLGLPENESIFCEEWPGVFNKFVYERLPNGIWFKEGDDYAWSSYTPNKRNTLYGRIFRYIGSTYDDPVILYQGLLDLEQGGFSADLINVLMTDIKDVEKLNIEMPTSLPLTRFTQQPMSTMTARTSWQNGINSPTAMAYVNMRELTMGDHQHRDLGAFQIWYKGMLAIDSGLYQYSDHHWNYAVRSVAHNVMLVDDPNEIYYTNYAGSFVPDGGQRLTANFANHGDDLSAVLKGVESGEAITAEEKAKFMGPDSYRPEFSYISADISSAYTDKVEAYERSAVFINLDNEDYPAAFIVYDLIKSSDATFKKKWLLHSETEPDVNTETNTTVITRTDNGQNGKLVNKTLIPAVGKGTIEKIGGPGMEFFSKDKNYPMSVATGIQADMGNWRIEISPNLDAQEDRFLNAMYVTDADRNLPELPMYREFGANYTGVTIMDKMVAFANDRNIIEGNIRLKVRDNGYVEVSCLVTDVKAGKWNVRGNGLDLVIESIAGENCLQFSAAPGTYDIVPVSPSTPVTQIDIIPEEPEDFGDFLIRRDSNLMYLPKPTKDVDGVPYVAVDGIFTQFETDIIENNGESITLKSGNDVWTITAGENTYVRNGISQPLTNAPMMIHGELYASVSDFQTLLNLKGISYNKTLKLLSFSFTSRKSISGVDMDKIVSPVAVTGSLHDGSSVINNLYDMNLGTYFCSVGSEAWAEFDLGEVYDIDKIMVAFFRGNTRKQIFDILVSEDGVNYKKVFSGSANGKTEDLQNFKIGEKARFIKCQFYGSDTGNMYNSIFEMLVIKE